MYGNLNIPADMLTDICVLLYDLSVYHYHFPFIKGVLIKLISARLEPRMLLLHTYTALYSEMYTQTVNKNE